jgi:hypothetical protein
MWRILTASLGAGTVSGHRMIDVIAGGGRRPGQQQVSVPGARCVARLPGTAYVPFTVAGAEIACWVRRHLAFSRCDARWTSPAGGRIDALPRSRQRRRGLVHGG